jgi:Fe-S oxidoreductase
MTALPVSNARRCLDCGKCTSVCPVARFEQGLSPRRLVRGLEGPGGGRWPDALWSCLTCKQCDAVCPQQVAISDVVPLLRQRARDAGQVPESTRCGAMQLVAVLQSQAELSQDRLGWIPDDVELDPESETLLWVGCLPYFDAFFTEAPPRTLEAAVGAIRILNALGIRPAVRADERCCGHDALAAGDEATFERLARMNLNMLVDARPERIVTVCPECQVTLDRAYRTRFGAPGCEVVHIASLIAEKADGLGLTGRPLHVTFHDPCRLGRHTGDCEAPRRALESVPDLALHEMPRSRSRAVCCAGSWLRCDQTTRRIQADRLEEARLTGAELMVTACPKCLVHYRCAQAAGPDEAALEIRDLTALIAGALPGPTERG